MNEASRIKRKGISLMLTATIFWGFMGINSRWLNDFDISSPNVAFARCSIAAILFSFYSFIANRAAFKVNLKGIIISAIYGIFTLGIGLALYSISIERIPIAIATVLMFSNPIWVSVYGAVLFKDKITFKTATVIFNCLLGCLLLMDVFSNSADNLDMIGVLCGIGNGMTFALQIIIPRAFKNKYSSDTMLIYGFWGATIFLLIFAKPINIIYAVQKSDNPVFLILNLLAIGILATFISNTFYVKSTEYIGTTLPSLMAACEPVFASIFALLIFKEYLSFIQVLGAVIVIGSIAFLSISPSDEP